MTDVKKIIEELEPKLAKARLLQHSFIPVGPSRIAALIGRIRELEDTVENMEYEAMEDYDNDA